MDLYAVRGNQYLITIKFAWLVVVEVDLIGGEDVFGRKLKNVGDNYYVSILIRSIVIHQE